jgi:hypothetical protein
MKNGHHLIPEYVNTKDHDKIVQFLNDPTLILWNQICNMAVTPKHTLWMAVVLYRARYINQNVNGRWVSFPDSIMLGNAIKLIVKFYQDSLEDNDFWPPPASAQLRIEQNRR